MSILWYKWSNPTYKAHYEIFKEYKFDVLNIDSEQWFISWDSPVVFWSKYIIFPISSKKCLIWSKTINKIFPLEIDQINTIIASNCQKIIFGNTKEIVEKYLTYLDKKDLHVLSLLDY